MCRYLTALLIFSGVTALAADDPKPNTLTPQEIADGWVLLFDGETTFGWKADGDASVTGGVLRVGGGKSATIELTSPVGACDVRFEYRVDGKVSPTLSFRGAWESPKQSLLSADIAADWLTSTVTVRDDTANGQTVIEQQDVWKGGQDKATGRVAAKSPLSKTGPFIPTLHLPEGATLSLRSVKLKPFDLRPVFNGKDLTGWRVFPGERYKSKFSVTPEGWLNVKDGPGDLQTEKQWSDFIFQGECFSNGKSLNSGVFFRCLPDQYQNGYEMQIHNGFRDNDRTKPVDFGTGAIYRRVAARKVVSSDGEWFAMTLVAHGNHFATWVNGYQVVDWTDARPANPNPRNGSKLGAGHLSIQGHDPTTDLSFRKLRIAELPKPN
jgi:hypothetical protein